MEDGYEGNRGSVEWMVRRWPDKQSCVITCTFEMNSTCMRSCDLNFSCLSTSITSPEVSGWQNIKRIQIQYGRSCLHFVSSNFNFLNLRQLLAFPRKNQLKSVNFVCIIKYYRNKCIYMNFRIKLIFHYVSAWQLSVQPDVIRDRCGCLALWALAVHRTSHA